MVTTATPPLTDAAPPTPERAARRSWVWPVLALVVLGVGVWACRSVTIDDAFITWRYSRHLAQGLGPTWNPGEDPVEGFTNFAWMVGNAGADALGLSMPVVSKLTSAVAAALVVLQLLREPATRAGAAVALGSLLAFLPTYVHIDAGLETMAVAAVLLRAAVLGLRVLHGRPVRVWELPLLALLAGMLRPEGVAAALPALLVWLWAGRREPRVWAATGVAVVVGAGYFAWRWSYFGYLLPNTFYIKFGNLASGQHWLQVTAAVLLPLLVLTGSLVLRRPAGPGLLLAATVGLCWLPYALSGPSMDYLDRFAYHAVPVLCLGAALALDHPDVRRRLAAVIAVGAVGWTAVAGVTADDARTIVNYGADLQRAHAAIGAGLAAADIPPAARTVAVSDAGVINYESDWRSLDYIGLNDEGIAHGESPDQAVAAAHPTVIVVTSTTSSPPARAYGLDVTAAIRGYVEVGTVQMRQNYYQLVYALPEFAGRIEGPLEQSVAAAQNADREGFELTYGRWLHRLVG